MKRLIFPLTLGLVCLCCGVLAVGAFRYAQRGLQSIVVDGRTRTYLVRTPDLHPSQTHPLIIVLHGGGGNAFNAEKSTGMTADAIQRGYIVCYPNGTGRFENALLTWNAGECCGYAMENNIDDVAFLRALVQKLEVDYPVDPQRVFVTGMSNGGMMSHRFGVEAGDVVAGIAPVAGALDCRLRGGPPVAAIMIHGDADQHVPIDGGRPSQGPAKNRVDRSLQQAVDYWVRRDGDSTQPERTQNEYATVDLYRGVFPVQTVVVHGGGHAWPGGSKGNPRGDDPSANVNANELILGFFHNVRK